MKKIAVVLFLACGFSSFAQKTTFEAKADDLYNVFAYSEAIPYYASSTVISTEGLRRLAECYLKLGRYTESEATYTNLVQRQDCLAEDFFDYAMILRTNDKYTDADIWMKKYADIASTDIRAISNISNLSKVPSLRLDQGQFKIANLGLNTEKQEFAPAFFGSQFVYTASGSTDRSVKKKYASNNQLFLDLFVKDTATLSTSDRLEFKREFNKKFHEGVVCFSSDLKRMYFTDNNYAKRGNDGTRNLSIFYTDATDKGEWSEPIAFIHNNNDYSVGHPSLSADGSTLYFASNMPGGFGGTDIYKSARDVNGNWGKPENLGSTINTEGDEMFPFYHSEKQLMFFASNGHFGIGGLDIFVSSYNKGLFGKVDNLGAPINSPYDDFSIILDAAMKKGYFSSNRIGGKGDDDIYSLLLTKTLKQNHVIYGKATDQANNPLPDATITLLDSKNATLSNVKSDCNGDFSFDTGDATDYSLTGEKPTYQSDKKPVNFDPAVSEHLVNLVLIGAKDKVPVLNTNTNTVVNPENGYKFPNSENSVTINSVYFDLNSDKIVPYAKIELDKIVTLMNSNKNMIVEVSAHTDCRDDDSYNLALSNRRAESCLKYIKSKITNPSRISGKGYGEMQPVKKCDCNEGAKTICTEGEHQLNRRTEFVIVKK